MDETLNNYYDDNNTLWLHLLSNPTKCNNIAALFQNICMLIFTPPCLVGINSVMLNFNTNTTLLISFTQNRKQACFY